MDQFAGLNSFQAVNVLDFVESLFSEAVCLAIQSTFFGVVFGVAMTYYSQNKDGWKLISFVTAQMALSASILVISWQEFTSGISNAFHSISQQLFLNDFPELRDPSELDPLSVQLSSDKLSVQAVTLAGVNILFSQLFLSYHVWRLNRRWPGVTCAAFIFVLSVVGFALSIYVQFGRNILNDLILHILQELFIVLADLIATIFLFRHFKKLRDGYVENRDVHVLNRTYRLMSKITLLAANRGALVTFAQFGFFAPTALNEFQWIPLNASLANVYVFTTLVILNSRATIRGTISNAGDTTNVQSVIAVRPWKPTQTFNIDSTIPSSDLELQSMLREEETG